MFSKTNTCSTRKRQEVFSFVRNCRLVVGKIQNFNTLTNFFVCVLHTASLAFTRSSKSTSWYTRIIMIYIMPFSQLIQHCYYNVLVLSFAWYRKVLFALCVHCMMLYEVENQSTYKSNSDSNLMWLYYISKKSFESFFFPKIW